MIKSTSRIFFPRSILKKQIDGLALSAIKLEKINGVLGVWVLGLCLTDRLGETTNPRSQTQPAKPKPKPPFFYSGEVERRIIK